MPSKQTDGFAEGDKVRLVHQLPGVETDYRYTGVIQEEVEPVGDGEPQFLVKLDKAHELGDTFQFHAGNLEKI